MRKAFGNDPPFPRFELYAGEKPPSRFDADPGQEPLSTADIHITQRTGPNVGAINLVPPISVVVQDDPIDAMWARSEEHTSELQSLMRISYAVFCLKKKKN